MQRTTPPFRADHVGSLLLPPAIKTAREQRARDEITAGHTVCIFAEGAITRTGNLLKFKRGLEQIAARAESPIVPVWLDGIWGSIFSFERGRFLFKRPRRLFAPVTVVFGPPLPSNSRALDVRQSLQELSVEAFQQHRRTQKPLLRSCKADGASPTTSASRRLERSCSVAEIGL